MPKSIFNKELKDALDKGIITEQETHFQRAEKIAYEDLAIALENERTAHQATKQREENLKAFIRDMVKSTESLDLSPATKEVNGMDVFKENKK